MKQRADQLLIGGFVVTLFLMSLTFFILPVESFSELENRYLQGIPHLTLDNVLSHKFSEEAEKFVTDQFPFRDKWVWMKSVVEQLRLQQENNGIYRGKDGYLFEKFVEPDYAEVQRYIEAVKNFSSMHPGSNMTFLLAPTSVGIYPERLPWAAPSYPQSMVNHYIAESVQDRVTFIDGFDFLSPHASESIFYRTDHHWTTNGAYLAYVAYAEKMGWKPMTKQEFHIQTVSDSFLGSYHTRGQFSGVTPDSIQVYTHIKDIATEMYIADTDETSTSMYNANFLEKKDQYSYFLGGVHALMKLTTKPDPSLIKQEKLLVIKDSYAHSVIPFLALHVPEIHVIDIRYYNGNISKYMSENGITDVLLLFNTATFIDNSALLKLDD